MRPLWQFLIRNYFVFLFFLLEALAITLFINNSYYQRAIVVNATNGMTGFFFGIRNGITQYFSLKVINDQLAEENARLLSMQDASFIKTDNHVFVYRDTLYRLEYQYITAKVINNSTNKSANFLTLNKGAKHGIRKDMAVVSPTGVVGIVNEVSDNFCSVMSMLHPQTKISAKLKKHDYGGTVVWEGGSPDVGNMKDVPIHVKIARGDTIITSGYSLMFPEGILIGTVSSFDVGAGNDFYNIKVKFSTDFNNLKHVYIINNLLKDELEKLERSAQGS
jgi:rod shape-determining protein MreC